MLVDSHCHLNFPDLIQRIDAIRDNMAAQAVSHALVISVNRPDYPAVRELAERFDNFYATVGVHPDVENSPEFSEDELVAEAQHPKVVGIGETGLDYHWCKGELEWQRERFRVHIRAARRSGLPLIVHTRDAADDTMAMLREGRAHAGVIHCFTENVRVARMALDLGFYISFSGIVTFKNAADIQEAAKYVPTDRILVETDAPYLAPVPKRGRQNEPAYVRHTAEFVAALRGDTLENTARTTTDNFYALFNKVPRPA